MNDVSSSEDQDFRGKRVDSSRARDPHRGDSTRAAEHRRYASGDFDWSVIAVIVVLTVAIAAGAFVWFIS